VVDYAGSQLAGGDRELVSAESVVRYMTNLAENPRLVSPELIIPRYCGELLVVGNRVMPSLGSPAVA